MRSLLFLAVIACSDDPAGTVPPPDAPPDPTDGGTTDPDTGAPATTPEPNPTTTGSSQQCVLLYGGNDRVRGPDEGLPVGWAQRTLQAWVRTNSELDQIAVSYGRPSPAQGLMLGTSGGYPIVRAGVAGGAVLGDTWIADDEWHHLVVAWDGRTAVLTLDGATDGVGELEADTLEGDLVAGNTPTGDQTMPWIGWLDDVRIFGLARWSTDIAADPEGELEPPSELLLWWDFETDTADVTGPGVAVPDLSGNGHDGTTGGAEDTPVFPACR